MDGTVFAGLRRFSSDDYIYPRRRGDAASPNILSNGAGGAPDVEPTTRRKQHEQESSPPPKSAMNIKTRAEQYHPHEQARTSPSPTQIKSPYCRQIGAYEDASSPGTPNESTDKHPTQTTSKKPCSHGSSDPNHLQAVGARGQGAMRLPEQVGTTSESAMENWREGAGQGIEHGGGEA